MPKLLTFAGALADADERTATKSVLLGNGFSIDFDPAIFLYESLAKEAKLPGLSVGKKRLFESLSSENFEIVIDKLKAAAALERLYSGSEKRARRMETDARIVRNGLADVLAARHPPKAQHLKPDQITHARVFLSNFGNIFTLNYDLLLYWVIMADEYGPSVVQKDGFEWPTFKDHSRIVWKTYPTRKQRIFFLHGALHLFVEDRRVRKLSYSDGGPLIDLLRERLDAGDYPLVVTEGNRREKEERIDRSRYLRTGLRRFGEIKGALFIHGMSMSDNDDHIIERIESENSGVTALYVGVHGSLKSHRVRLLMKRAKEIVARRDDGQGRRLRLRFYDAASAHVWRD